MIEKSAEKVRGFLLYSPFTHEQLFRVYGEVDPVTGQKLFTDYNLCAEDIEVTIESSNLSLYECEDGDQTNNKLDYCGHVLGRDGKDP